MPSSVVFSVSKLNILLTPLLLPVQVLVLRLLPPSWGESRELQQQPSWKRSWKSWRSWKPPPRQHLQRQQPPPPPPPFSFLPRQF